MWLSYLEKINSSMDLSYILIRTFIIYIYAIFLIRTGNKRFHFDTPIDFVLIIIIGAVLSRTINGPSTLIQAMAGSALLIFLHWAFAKLSFKYHTFGKLIKGKPRTLIKDGKIIWAVLEENQISKEDLLEIIRDKLKTDNLDQIKEAYLERTGKISFITKNKKI
ncbi:MULTISPECIES: DUF421 domain-containing protein [Legionella]|uniref:DUF421 domain-containing protein n=1 Tax=Legionella resiliens TaxID=2905958 RepID=A0ABS8X347_9GAMM|nr:MULTISPECIES: YetF domain-containing protein [unclassified Legionella]MCE0724040.1 DUF421 domain-containing protein [Legionella sp. 9fVS26]MCE3533193.1 DUF421 domain-containing protein [Legionella sp. 8cVS16]QLZ69373.1 hypothetical protein FOLKNPGA_02156 [Legionella sp. PC1000]